MSMEWHAIVERLQSKNIAVFNYDRILFVEGLSSETSRDVDTLVVELRDLLQQRGISGPYLIIGHSYGGLIAQCFACSLSPQSVAGMVLIDPAHECQYDLLPRDFVFGFKVMVPIVLRFYQRVARSGFLKLMDRFSLFNFPPIFLLPREMRLVAANFYSDPKVWKRVAKELEGCFESFESLARVPVKTHRDFHLPIGLVIANRRIHTPSLFPQEVSKAFVDLHQELIDRNLTKVFMADRSDHWVHMEQPDVVVAAIDYVVEAIQAL